MNRKVFLKKSAAAGFALPLIGNSFLKEVGTHPIIKPAKLSKSDTLALVTPGSYITEDELQQSMDNLQQLGFNAVYSNKLLLQNGYFSATDAERANDLMGMFKRKDVNGIVCARGGYGCARILPLLDYDVIKSNPKVLIGYSDVTALHLGIFKKTGLITFHGPVGTSTFNDFTKEYFDKVLLNPQKDTLLINSTNVEDENIYGVTTLVNGEGEGILTGGNLSIVVSLIGTEFDIETKNKIIFLEEIGEEPYRIDRMLTQMIQAGKFDNAAGVAMGIFRNCESKLDNPSFEKSLTLMEVLQDRLGNLKIPVVYGMSFGHVKDKFTLPVGVNVKLNADEQTIVLLESAVY
jgi:muramoyltetrapeptide carboxypeptidase